MATGKLPPVFPALGSFEDDAVTPVTQSRPAITIAPVIEAAVSMNLRRRPAHANNYTHVARKPTLIIIHCTDGHEGLRKDEDVAAMFADPNLHPRRSAHYVVDTDSVTQCVDDELQAWHCGKTGNQRGIGIELCGKASQSYDQWHDSLSMPMLRIAARLVATLCDRHLIPCVYLTSRELVAGKSGVTTHASVSLAFGESTHTDPGAGFPMVKLVSAARAALGVPT